MTKARSDAVNAMVQAGLSLEMASDIVRSFWGVSIRESLDMAQERDKRHIKGVRKRQDLFVERAWSELLTPLRQRIREHKSKLTDRRPSEATFYLAALHLMEKTRDYIEGARMKALAHCDPDKPPTPSQVAFAKKLPNNGLHWVDWVPQRVRQALQVEEDIVHSSRGDCSRKPNIFGIKRGERDRIMLRNHKAAIAEDRHKTQAMVNALMRSPEWEKDTGAPVRLAKLKLHIRLCDAALRALERWPVTRAVPPNPLHILGVSPQALDEATRQNPAVLDPNDPEYEEVARTVIAAAQARVAAGKKQRERAVARAMVDANNEVAHVPAGHSSGRPPAPVRPRPIKEAPPTTLGIPVSPGVDDEMRRHVLEMFPAKGDARHAGGTTIASPGAHMAWLDEIDEDDA